MLSLIKNKSLTYLLIKNTYSFGSYYDMVKMFESVEATPGNKAKISVIKAYKDTLTP